MNDLKIAVLGSTNGTDLQALIDNQIPVEIVISNKSQAGILERAEKAGIPVLFVSAKDKTRERFDQEVIEILKAKEIDLILLIGYMRYLSADFVNQYRNKIMNIHPSLLPAFAGGMDQNVHQEVLKSGVKITGCTLHFVDEGADTGPMILQKEVVISEDETIESLKNKVQRAEQEVILQGIELFKQGKI
jgi:formyltetrahydrofolate-dependent phosphoribosylglycinamide formyltransferase